MNHRACSRSLRFAVTAFALAGLTACDDDGAGPGPGLQPEDVAGNYSVCQLVFDPAGTVVPQVDIRATVFDFPGGLLDPKLGIDPNAQRTIELSYIPKGQVNDREIHGTYNLRGSDVVELRFNANGVDPKTLLLPENQRIDFEYQESPLRLVTAASPQYNVTRDAYVAISGQDPQNLPATISGVLIAEFRSDGCGG